MNGRENRLRTIAKTIHYINKILNALIIAESHANESAQIVCQMCKQKTSTNYLTYIESRLTSPIREHRHRRVWPDAIIKLEMKDFHTPFQLR